MRRRRHSSSRPTQGPRPTPGPAVQLPAPCRPLLQFLPTARAVTAPPRWFSSWRDELGVVAGMVAVSADRHDVALLILEVRETRSCPSYLHVRNPAEYSASAVPTFDTPHCRPGRWHTPRCRHLLTGFFHGSGASSTIAAVPRISTRGCLRSTGRWRTRTSGGGTRSGITWMTHGSCRWWRTARKWPASNSMTPATSTRTTRACRRSARTPGDPVHRGGHRGSRMQGRCSGGADAR